MYRLWGGSETLIVAVSKCLDWSGLLLITTALASSPLAFCAVTPFYHFSLTCSLQCHHAEK